MIYFLFYDIMFLLEKEDRLMNQNLKKEMLKSIEITRESLKNSMEITLESYAESVSRLDMLAYLLLINDKK